jgi:hypothetical protein
MLVICGGLIALPVVPVKAQKAYSPGSADSADLNLALKKVSLYEKTGKVDEAFALIDKMKKQYPNNPQLLQAEADLNYRHGNRVAAFSVINKAAALDPSNEDIMEQRNYIMSGESYASGGYNFRRTNEAKEQFSHFIGQYAFSPSLSSMLKIENDHLQSRKPITRVDGQQQNFYGNRQRGSLTFGKMFENGDEANLSLYAGNSNVGGGGQYSKWDRSGTSILQFNINRPDWDYVETVVENGTKDNIHLERQHVFNENLHAILGAGFNNYNLKGASNSARSADWNLNIGYSRPYRFSQYSKDEVTLGVYYTVDAEYFTHVDRRVDSSGTRSKIFPASSYEVHSLNASVRKELAEKLFVEGFGGYSLDRLGGSGPSFGGSIEYNPVDKIGVDLRASRGIMGARGGEKVDQVSLNVKWQW